MSNELAKAFNPAEYEHKLYELWEKSGAFKPQGDNSKPFSIIMPPPNANGSLHIGHAVFVTLQDIMIRYHRMLGDETLWLPGADHAGFETQVVYQKKLEKEDRNWYEIPRDQLYKEIKDFTLDHKKHMEDQLRRLGASCDWTKEKFTLDEDIIDIVYQTFIELYKDGLVYRDNRLINWCVKHQTTLSDLEVKFENKVDSLYYVNYGPLVVATVRPETMFGDVAVAVNPSDKRYQKLIGQMAEIPIINRKIPIIADETVDIEFGTGAVKVTPSVDQNDFIMGQKHKLDSIEIVDKFGRLTDKAPAEFSGLKVAVARLKVAEKLQQIGALDSEDKKYIHAVATCYKCHTTLEPRILPQWWIAMTKRITPPIGRAGNQESRVKNKSLKDLGLEAVENNEVTFVTEHFKKIYLNWLKGIRDWNISRQIVWGIRLPVWYCNCNETIIQKPNTGSLTFFRHGQAEHNIKNVGNGDPKIPYHLTDLGKEQVKESIIRLKKEGQKFDAIIASEMPRVKETAEILKEAFGCEVTIDPRLNDVHLGELEGKPSQETLSKTNFHEISIGGSETFDQIKKRLESFVADQIKSNQSKKILVVTSQILMWTLPEILKVDLNIDREENSITNGEYRLVSLENITVCPKCHNLATNRDQDVFDTWFSSGQWPFATLKTSQKKMGFAGDIVNQVFENKTRTYRLRDHEFSVGDEVIFEDSSTVKPFGTGLITEVKQVKVSQIDLKDEKHWKTYNNHQELITAFKRHSPQREVNLDTPVWIYTYEFNKEVITDFDKFYPTSVMETGHDIIFFWIARMIMLGKYKTGQVPFKHVFMHGLVRDKDRQKMSKSKGNVIDPLGVAEQYGVDAVRMALVFNSAPGNDFIISEDKIRGMRNFANKVWNVARFVIANLENNELGIMNYELSPKTEADKEIVEKLNQTIESVTKNIDTFQFHESAQKIYDFIWHDLADVYIEASKSQIDNPETKESTLLTLHYTLCTSLKLLHPFMPYVTEALWQEMLERKLVEDKMLIKAQFPFVSP